MTSPGSPLLVAGLPVETGGVTVNRNCASSLQAINDAAMNVAANCEDVQIAGGIEHMDHIPMSKDYSPFPGLNARHGEAVMNMGLTAEYLAAKYRISRKRQDEFALRSHQLAAAATDSGQFRSEIVPTWGRDDQGRKCLARLRPVHPTRHVARVPRRPGPCLQPGGRVGHGRQQLANQRRFGRPPDHVGGQGEANPALKPLARIRSMAVAGVDPSEMGIGPVPAVHKALARAGIALADVGCFELNEAFAVQVLSVLKLLGLPEEKVNTRGGAIAIGHPLGASGARIATTLLHRMRDVGAKFWAWPRCASARARAWRRSSRRANLDVRPDTTRGAGSG